MKKIIYIFCLLISYTSFAQKPIKYKAVNYFYIERSNGKKAFSKPEKNDNEILFDTENKIIKLHKEEEHIFQIIESDLTSSGSNFSITNYKCIDENKVECNLSLYKFLKPNKSQALQQLFISYPNIEYVYDINLVGIEK